MLCLLLQGLVLVLVLVLEGLSITSTSTSRSTNYTPALIVSRKPDRPRRPCRSCRRAPGVGRLRRRQLSQPARREFLLDLALVALEQLLQRLGRRVRQRLQQQVGLRLVLQDAGQPLHLLLEILPVRLAIGGQGRLIGDEESRGDGERGRQGDGEIRRSGSPTRFAGNRPVSPSPRPPVRRLQRLRKAPDFTLQLLDASQSLLVFHVVTSRQGEIRGRRLY